MKSVVTIKDGFEDEVTGNELKYLIKLGRHLCNKSKVGWPSTNTLSELTKLSVKTIYNITKSLEVKKVIEVKRRKVSGKNLPNMYRLTTSKIRFDIQGVGTEFTEEETDGISGVKNTDGSGVKITDELSSSKEEHVQSDVKAEFATVWEMYGKKKNKAKSFKAYKNLTKRERLLCVSAIPAYVASTPDVQYRALLSTYIHGKRWEDETEQDQPMPDIKLNESWEASYQRFTKALNDAMGSRSGKVSQLTRSEYVEWSNHQRRRLTSRLTKNNWHKTMLAWIKANVEGMSTYKLQKELKTADALLWHAFSEWMKQRGYWGEFKEPNNSRYPGPLQASKLVAA